MPHRDDFEAALQRVSALERDLAKSDRDSESKASELKRLRGEVEQLRKRVGEEDERKKQSSRSNAGKQKCLGKSPRRKRFVRIAMIALSIGTFIAATTFVPLHCARQNARSETGKLEDVVLVRGESGEPLLLAVSVYSQNGEDTDYAFLRLDAMEPASGKRLVRVLLNKDGNYHGSSTHVAAASPGRFWVIETRNNQPFIEVRSTSNLKVIADHGKLAKTIPELAVGLHGAVVVDSKDGRAIVATREGHQISIDPKTLVGDLVHLTPSERTNERYWRLGQSSSGSSSRARDNGGTYRFFPIGSSQRNVFTRTHEDGRPQTLAHENEESSSAAILFEPSFLLQDKSTTTTQNGGYLLVPGGGFVIKHQERLGKVGKDNSSLVSGMNLQGELLWTHKIPDVTFLEGFVFGDVAVLVFQEYAKGYLLAFELSTGKLVWQISP